MFKAGWSARHPPSTRQTGVQQSRPPCFSSEPLQQRLPGEDPTPARRLAPFLQQQKEQPGNVVAMTALDYESHLPVGQTSSSLSLSLGERGHCTFFFFFVFRGWGGRFSGPPVDSAPFGWWHFPSKLTRSDFWVLVAPKLADYQNHPWRLQSYGNHWWFSSRVSQGSLHSSYGNWPSHKLRAMCPMWRSWGLV